MKFIWKVFDLKSVCVYFSLIACETFARFASRITYAIEIRERPIEFRCKKLELNQAYRSPWNLSFRDAQHNERNEELHRHSISLWIAGVSQIYSVLQKEKKAKPKTNILHIKNKIRYEILRTTWSKQVRKDKLFFIIFC